VMILSCLRLRGGSSYRVRWLRRWVWGARFLVPLRAAGRPCSPRKARCRCIKKRKGVNRRGAGPEDASLFGRGAGEGLGVHICTGPVAVKERRRATSSGCASWM
jgi:hypothetical protein